MIKCHTWNRISSLREELIQAVEFFSSFRHPRVIARSVELDASLNECGRCVNFPCEIVQRHQAMTQIPLNWPSAKSHDTIG